MYVYIAQYPLRWTAESALHLFMPTPIRHTCEKHSTHRAITHEDYAFTHISTYVYSHISLIFFTAELI